MYCRQKKYKGSYDTKGSFWVQSHSGMLGIEPPDTEPPQDNTRGAVEENVVEVTDLSRHGEAQYDSLSPKEIDEIISKANSNNNSQESLVGDIDWNPYAHPLIHRDDEEENHYEGVVVPPHAYEDVPAVERNKAHTLPTTRITPNEYSIPATGNQYSNIPGTNIIDSTNTSPQYANTLDGGDLKNMLAATKIHSSSLPNGILFNSDSEKGGYATPRKFPLYDSIRGSSNLGYTVMSPEQSDLDNDVLTSATPVPTSGLF